MRSKIWQGWGIGLAAAAAALALWASGALDRFEAKTWDWRAAALARPGPFTGRVRLIFIDQYSLDWASREMALRWPWPREVYRPILEFCRRQGARAVAFDMLYTEPSYQGVADDQAFGSAIAATPGYVGAVFLGRETGQDTNWPAGVPEPRAAIAGLAAWRAGADAAALDLPRAVFPIPEVATNAAWLGNVEARPDPDAIFRRLPLFAVFDGRPVPALGLAAYLAATNVPLAIEPGWFRLGRHRIPVDRRGAAILRFRGPSQTHRRYSAAAVIQSEMNLQAGERPPIEDPAAFKDCFVLLGCNAPGLLDLRPSPVGRVYSGVELHATLLDNLLALDAMRDAPWPLTAVLVLLLGAGWGLAILHCRTVRATVLALAAALPVPAALCVAAYLRGYWLPFLAPESATVLAAAGAVLLNYATEGRQKRFIRGAFKQYLSEHVIEELVAHPERLQLGGEQRTLSIFFSDLQGFTSISEGLDPQALTALLNAYLTAMTDLIQEQGGTVDKYEGDAIIAFWNAPLAQADHPARAVQAALRCQEALAAMRPGLRERIGKDLFMRIGLHTGPVVVGNMGSRNRFNYTILGDAANLASRLEGINKQFGTYTLVSEATRAALGPEFAVREIAQVAVVGRRTPVRVFEPMRPETWAARRATFERFALGLRKFYEGRFQEAAAAFEALASEDPPAAAYARKCRALPDPPPAGWAGVWVMTEK